MSDAAALRVRREPPRFRRVAVVEVSDLTPYLRRIVLGGHELDGFEVDEPGASVRLLLPADGELVMPRWTGNQFELPSGERAPIRTLTPRAVDADRRQLCVDIVLHERGVMSDWARRAEVGDEVAISGPGRGFTLDGDVGSILLAGDETAIPAIAQLLEHLPPVTTPLVHVEVRHADARLDLGGPAGEVHWHVAAGDTVPGDALVDAVTAIDELPQVIWAAGEAAAMQRLRKHLFDERGLPRAAATVRGYWKHGRAET